MAYRGKPMTERSFPWWQSGFDLEGIAGFLAGWLIGILLGMLWGPLFWLGFIPGLVILFATRTAERVSPEEPSLIVSPCDGVVVSVEDIDPPEELKLAGRYKRVRISSSPFSANNIHAPIEGLIDLVTRQEGAAEAFAAMKPDSSGLEVLFMTISGAADSVGLRVATGGLGPRLEARGDAGDRVVAGKTIATRRLGGWTDIFVPAGGKGLVVPGRTLIGGETHLWRLGALGGENVDFEDDEDERTELDADYPVTPDPTPPEIAEDVEEETGEKSTDPAEMFARLRREASKASGEDSQD